MIVTIQFKITICIVSSHKLKLRFTKSKSSWHVKCRLEFCSWRILRLHRHLVDSPQTPTNLDNAQANLTNLRAATCCNRKPTGGEKKMFRGRKPSQNDMQIAQQFAFITWICETFGRIDKSARVTVSPANHKRFVRKESRIVIVSIMLAFTSSATVVAPAYAGCLRGF